MVGVNPGVGVPRGGMPGVSSPVQLNGAPMIEYGPMLRVGAGVGEGWPGVSMNIGLKLTTIPVAEPVTAGRVCTTPRKLCGSSSVQNARSGPYAPGTTGVLVGMAHGLARPGGGCTCPMAVLLTITADPGGPPSHVSGAGQSRFV